MKSVIKSRGKTPQACLKPDLLQPCSVLILSLLIVAGVMIFKRSHKFIFYTSLP